MREAETGLHLDLILVLGEESSRQAAGGDRARQVETGAAIVKAVVAPEQQRAEASSE